MNNPALVLNDHALNRQTLTPPANPLALVARLAGDLLERLAGQDFEPIRLAVSSHLLSLELVIQRGPARQAAGVPRDAGGLSPIESAIVETLAGGQVLAGPAIAERAGWPYETQLKSALASLRRRGLIDNKAPGYVLVREPSEEPHHP